MKKKFAEFFKGKGYYVLLFVGVIAIAAVALIGTRLSSQQNKDDNNYVDLNDTDNNIAQGEDTQLPDNNQTSEDLANNEDNGSNDLATNDNGVDVADNDSLLEYDIYSGDGQTGDTAQSEDEAQTASADVTPPPAVETSGQAVQAPDINAAIDKLSFKTDEGLIWPVNGNVIMNYSMDHTIYFATLMQFKCNPAIIIDAEVGTEVKAAADGIVSDIEENEETGCTVTIAIGNGYSLVYGQLDKSSLGLEVGDSLKAGDKIGSVAEPTKYYVVEGSNLYFEMLENDQTVNPMLYLQ